MEWGERVADDYGLEALKFFKSTITARGTSTTLPILNKSAFQSLAIPVPPRDLQDDFALVVSSLERLCIRQITAEESEDNFFASLQQRAFSGQL